MFKGICCGIERLPGFELNVLNDSGLFYGGGSCFSACVYLF